MGGSAAGMGAGPVIPYAGSFGGFMPYRMGGGSALSVSSRDASAMGAARSSFRLSSGSAGMSSSSGGMAQALGTGSRSTGSLSTPGAMGLSRDTRQPMRLDGSNVMPPDLGYPFYQPPIWSAGSASSGGMP